MNPSAERIFDFVLQSILDGEVAANDPLPKEVDLAQRFGANRMSAQLAMRELQRHGIVRRKRRVGTMVQRVPSPSLAAYLRGLSANRVHVVAGLEAVPLHWSAATLGELDSMLAQEGFRVTSTSIPEPLTPASLEAMLKTIADEGSTALLLILPGQVSGFCQAHADLILRYHRNVYLFDRGDTPPAAWPFNVVSLDPFSEGVLAAEFLYRRGYRRIAFWSDGRHPLYWAQQRAAGVSLGLQRASADACALQHLTCPRDGSLDSIFTWLRGQGGPSAVVAANDEYAACLLDAAAPQRLQPARDFGLIGFDNNPNFRAYNLTTVAPPVARVAGTLAQLLSGKLLSADDFSSVVLRLPSSIIERNTCRPPVDP